MITTMPDADKLIWDDLNDFPAAIGWYVVERVYDDGDGRVDVIRGVERFDGERWSGLGGAPYVFLPVPVSMSTDPSGWDIEFP